MYESFTPTARKVFQMANQEAIQMNHEYIGTEHLLLGLVRVCNGVAGTVLKNHDIDQKGTRLKIDEHLEAGHALAATDKLPLAPLAKKVVEYAIEEFRNLIHDYIGTEHILLGLLREQEGIAAKVLAHHGLTADIAREEIKQIISSASLPDSNTSPRSVALSVDLINTETMMEFLFARRTSNLPATGLAEVFDRLIWCMNDQGAELLEVRKKWLEGEDC